MKRILGLLASVGLFLVIGCARDYDFRLDKTIDNLRYQKQLDSNLEKPPESKSNLVGANIYVRSPLGLKGPAKDFGMGVVEAGKFDITDSFIGDQASLHILARVDRPKAPTTKKGANPTAPPPTTRGDFTSDVIDCIKTTYGADIETSKLKPDPRKTNNFKSITLDLTAKEVQIYILGEKNSPAQVALDLRLCQGCTQQPQFEDQVLPGVVSGRGACPSPLRWSGRRGWRRGRGLAARLLIWSFVLGQVVPRPVRPSEASRSLRFTREGFSAHGSEQRTKDY